ncbi:MAG: hypothetical protein DI528_06040 [Shinella sp.]|nr:MAG: hypothetical protein DI528_06040 [Shinella sp.]
MPRVKREGDAGRTNEESGDCKGECRIFVMTGSLGNGWPADGVRDAFPGKIEEQMGDQRDGSR